MDPRHELLMGTMHAYCTLLNIPQGLLGRTANLVGQVDAMRVLEPGVGLEFLAEFAAMHADPRRMAQIRSMAASRYVQTVEQFPTAFLSKRSDAEALYGLGIAEIVAQSETDTARRARPVIQEAKSEVWYTRVWNPAH